MPRKLGILLLLLFSLFLIGCNDNKVEDKVVATVNDAEITQAELNEYYNLMKKDYELQTGKTLSDKEDKEFIRELKDKAFDELVLQTIVAQDAEKKGLKITEAEIVEELKVYKDTQGEVGYAKFLEQLGITEAQLKNFIKHNQTYIKLKDMVTAEINVTDEEILNFYNDNKEEFTEPAGIEIFHILVESEQEANNILTKLDEGADFSKLAAEFSTCPSKDVGGDLGVVNENSNLVPEFKEVALKLKSGEITTKPVKTEFGYHIIKAGNNVEAKRESLDEVKSDISSYLKANKQNEFFNNYIDNLRANAKVEDKR